MTSDNTKSGIRKVAQQAGVSTATVSRVLNRSDSVSHNTRVKVEHAIQSTGYRFNAAARALSTRRTRTIAAIVPTLRHSIFAVFLEAFEDALASAGYSLVIATHGFDHKTEHTRCLEVLKLGAEAVVVSGADHSPQMLYKLKSEGVPCVLTSGHRSMPPFPAIGYNNAQLAQSAISYLIELGHREIHVLHGPTNNNDRMRDRVDGALSAARKDANVTIKLFETNLSVSGGASVANQWLSSKNLPHAVLCLADVMALGVMFEANKFGVKIPDRLSVMGFENLDWTADSSPPLTTISLPAEEMGKGTAAALVNYLDNNIEITSRIFDGAIVERESTKKRVQLKSRTGKKQNW